MAYVNLLNIRCTTQAEIFMRIRDFVCKRNGTYDYSTTGIGWTIHDSSYATDEDNVVMGDWVVMYSAGESTEEQMYIKMTYTSEGYLGSQLYLYWNNSTHVGSTAVAGVTSTFYLVFTSYNDIWIYGDLSSVVGIARPDDGSVYNSTFFGQVADDELYELDKAFCSAGISSGSDVVATFDSVPATWETDGKLYLWDDIGAIEIVTVNAISGNDITFTTIVGNYSANCIVSKCLPYACSGGSFGLNNLKVQFSKASVYNDSVLSATITTPLAYSSPDPFGRYSFSRIPIADLNAGYIGYFRNVFLAGTGTSSLDVHTNEAGDNYRYFGLSGGPNVFLLEV